MDANAAVTAEWSTLINPQREVGASEIHGLTGADLHRAPTFDMVAGDVADMLAGRVPVAHNLSFDALFLAAEFERLGVSVPLGPTAGLCTMRLASRYLRGGARNLAACCEGIGCPVESAHSALDDARAAARLLAHYLAVDPDFAGSWASVMSSLRRDAWPTLPSGVSRPLTRAQCASAQPEHFLARMAVRTPRSELHPEANSYLALIDRALLDRRLSRHEEDELVELAGLLGLSRDQARQLHRRYLCALGRLATNDGIVTREERSDPERVAALLGLGDEDVAVALRSDDEVDQSSCAFGGFCLRSKDAVVFTGDAPTADRFDLEIQARSLGLRVTSAVSRKSRLLVAADPDSLSGKARKARELGVPIVDYEAYFRMLDAGVQGID